MTAMGSAWDVVLEMQDRHELNRVREAAGEPPLSVTEYQAMTAEYYTSALRALGVVGGIAALTALAVWLVATLLG